MCRPSRAASWLPSVARTNAAPAPTGFELIALSPSLVAARAPGAPVRVELGVLVAGHGQSLEIRTKRPTYANAWVSTLTIRGEDGRRLRSLTLPRGTVTTSGLRQFGTVVVSSAGEPVASGMVSWCPGRNLHQRVDGDSVTDAIYPTSCSLHPFALGRLNGLERGWGSAVATSLALPASLPDGEYDVEFTVNPTMASRLRLSGEARRVRLTLTLVTTATTAAATVPSPEPEVDHSETANAAILASTEVAHELAAAPSADGPAQDTLPDLSALPAYRVRATREGDRDVLTFAANTWNRGPAPLVVEGYRIPGTELMDANQIFYRDGVPVSSAPIGQMLFHHGVGRGAERRSHARLPRGARGGDRRARGVCGTGSGFDERDRRRTRPAGERGELAAISRCQRPDGRGPARCDSPASHRGSRVGSSRCSWCDARGASPPD